MIKLSSLALGIICLATNLVLSQSTLLDPSFAGDGLLTINWNPDGGSWSSCIAVQADGKLVVGGNAWAADETQDFALARFNSDGSLDDTFGVGGVVFTEIGSMYEAVYDLAIQPDGKIVVAGRSNNSNNLGVFVIARYNQDGTLDADFGDQGVQTASFGIKGYVNSMVLQPDGKILLGGYVQNPSFTESLAFARFTTNGILDSTFSQDGLLIHDINYGAQVQAIALQPDGKFLSTGYLHQTPMSLTNSYYVTRFLPNGDVDVAFGTNGLVKGNFENGISGAASAIAVLTDGKVLIGGGSGNAGSSKYALARFNSNGALDATFDGDGKLVTELAGWRFGIQSMVIQPDSKIVAGGAAATADFSNREFLALRLNQDGSPDISFGEEGYQASGPIGFHSNLFNVYEVALQNDGKILLTGAAGVDGVSQLGICRFLPSLNVGVFNRDIPALSTFFYPNPITEKATLQYTLARAGKISIQLLDFQSHLLETYLDQVSQEAGAYSQPIVLPAGLPAGAYSLVLTSGQGQMSVRIIK